MILFYAVLIYSLASMRAIVQRPVFRNSFARAISKLFESLISYLAAMEQRFGCRSF